jgi:hypothetical protein
LGPLMAATLGLCHLHPGMDTFVFGHHGRAPSGSEPPILWSVSLVWFMQPHYTPGTPDTQRDGLP